MNKIFVIDFSSENRILSRSSGDLVKASGCLLSMLSPVWRAKLCRGFSADSRWRLELEDSDLSSFGQILELFSGLQVKLVGGIKELMELGRIADLYGMEDVLHAVEDEAMRQLTIETCSDLMTGSSIAGLARLELASRNLALNNFDAFAVTQGFLHLCEEALEGLLADDGLKSEKEEKVFEALVRWMRGAEGELRGENLLRKVRFPLMTQEYLDEKVRMLLPDVLGLSPMLRIATKAAALNGSAVTESFDLGSLDAKAFAPRCSQREVEWSRYSDGGEARIPALSDTFSLAVWNGFVCCGLWDGSITVWNTTTLKAESELTGHRRVVCALIPWKKWLISGSSDNTIMVWDMHAGTCEKVLRGHSGGVNALAISRDWLLSTSDDSTVKAWKIARDPTDWHCERTLVANKGGVRCVVTWGDKAITGSADKSIRVLDLATGAQERRLRGHRAVVNAMVVEGNRLFSASVDGSVREWKLDEGTCLKTVQVYPQQSSHYVWCLAVSGSKLLCGSDKGEMLVWDGATLQQEHKLKTPGNQAVRYLAVDQGQVWASVGRQILVWGRDT
jgi:hypothetical protein